MIFKIFGLILLNIVIANSLPFGLLANNYCNGNIKECLNGYKENLFSKDEIKRPTPEQLCEICGIVVPFVRELVRKNDTKYFKDIATLVCVGLKITQPEICESAVGLFENPVLSIINDTTLNDEELCSAGIGCGPILNPILNWNISLPNVPKPPVKPINPPSPSAPKLRILHLSDIHTDLEYQPGSLAACGQPLCCRNSSTQAGVELNENTTAGYWGDYRNCDVPLWTVENMFDYISKNEKFDFIYWTGDLPPHNVWNQSKSDQLHALDVVTNLFLKYFPDKVIYPSLGNHEATPVNLYPPPFIKEDNITWLYTALARDWTKTGLPSYLSANISSGAFYTIQLYPGLRLISLNTNYCPGGNFWLYVNSTDPLGQLDWLVNTLQESENIGEKVHIIGHIHPSGCLDSWSQNYYRIINRYESTIVGQFFGHSHSDEFELFYDLEDKKRAVSVLYIVGSVTTYSYLNPAYRFYDIDGVYQNSSFQVLDHETHFMNLTEANLSLKPNWQVEYSAKQAYNLTSLTPTDWGNLLDSMLDDLNGTYVDKLRNFNSKSADVADNCDIECRKSFVCGFKQARSDYFIPC